GKRGYLISISLSPSSTFLYSAIQYTYGGQTRKVRSCAHDEGQETDPQVADSDNHEYRENHRHNNGHSF
ncbi:hypothetical protein, partial [Bacteroides fragilis]|uniref:hypothetical protein n=1 Tax=Bacteroides fragilis TaxID=817 RepID=UPI00319E1802